jgi:hypothetical protein
MKCISGKNQFESEDLAKEALIQNRIYHNHREGSGPINIYECPDCNEWHFTSKGETAKFLQQQEVKERIEKEKKLNEWKERF